MSRVPAVDQTTRTFTEEAFVVFLRFVALLALLEGLKYWVALIGIVGHAPWRFDLMPVHWQIAATSLAVLFPSAATGLWLTTSWGPVLWAVAAAGEVVMYTGYTLRFGHQPIILAAHAVIALCYVGFRLALVFERRRRVETVRPDLP
ncbi:DUF6163 family protein [Pararhizobium mangrovi]|uniref:DUF2127 domain-containing protein n=1 Tax=Pararhizobium mangrovi TaxID=2590452 RepID=A0A506UD52_9HYPH|nr:DUF6163 family protein [Pararhizobium mangrovi]TPW31860.1 hypothetical protein FJU11_02565 [Pararhizobium mangrovi]